MLGNKVILCNPLDVVNEKEDEASTIWTLGKPFAQKDHQRTKSCQNNVFFLNPAEKKTLRAHTKMKLVQINSIVIGEQYKTNSHYSLEREAVQDRHWSVASQ